MKRLKQIFTHSGWGYVLFWGWNALYITFAFLGFTPFVALALFDAVRNGVVPWQFMALALLLLAVPLVMMFIGARVFGASPGKLLALGYGFEAPVLIGMLARFFGLRELTPPVAMLFASLALGLLVFLWQMLWPARGGNLAGVLRLAGLSVLLVTGVYLAALMAFYAVPAIGMVFVPIRALFEGFTRGDFRSFGAGATLVSAIYLLVSMVMGGVFLMATSTLFAGLPIAAPIVYVRAWREAFARLGSSWRLPAGALCAAIAAAWVGGFVWLNKQPQHAAFAMLDRPALSTSEANVASANEPQLRDGLLNAYLHSYRYLGVVGEVRHVQEMWMNLLGVRSDVALAVQNAYDVVARPFLYEPVAGSPVEPNTWRGAAGRDNATRAGALYESWFDEPINRAERDTVVNSVRSTWNADLATTAWQAVDDREIELLRQELTLTERDGIGNFELHEVYRNVTSQRQEVVYYFSLPESAVITGVWLGDSDDRAKRFVYQVAPRGAAQQVYKEQVQIRVDPALVEQLGPRQYRLRVFPIEPPRMNWDSRTGRSEREPAPEMHMWLTWQALPANGAWQLPRLAEKRNVYWTPQTTRTLNGAPFTLDAWLPGSAPHAGTPAPLAANWQLANGLRVSATRADVADWERAASGLKLAVILDRSRSMGAQRQAAQQAVQRLRGLGIGSIDLLRATTPQHGEAPGLAPLPANFDATTERYVGNTPLQRPIEQFNALAASGRYDAVIMLTDQAGYEQGAGGVTLTTPVAPLWMVHLGGWPLAYTDEHLAAMQASGGGAVERVDDALKRIVLARQQKPGEVLGWEDGVLWRVERTNDAGTALAANAPLAARRAILAEMQRNRGRINDVALLDSLHAVAKQHSIVTPYSSMVVLVNEAQRKRLEELEKGDDRFAREAEQVGETDPQVTGVPEPHEWLLIGLAALALWTLYRRRQPRLARG